MPPKAKPMLGVRVYRLVVIEENIGKTPYGETIHRCRCDCGNIVDRKIGALRPGHRSSCGCEMKERLAAQNKSTAKHGLCLSAEYQAWNNMIQRCTNPENPGWQNYGGRGISVCRRWRESFEAFYKDMGPKPEKSRGWTIGRINNDGPYSPQNCKWETHKENQRNKRTNRLVKVYGKEMTCIEAAEIAGIKKNTFMGRLDAGWTPDEAVATPILRSKHDKSLPRISK